MWHLKAGLIICKSFKRSRTFNGKQELTSNEEILMVHVCKPMRLRQQFQPNLGYVAESLYNKKKKRREKEKEAGRVVETRKMIPRRKYGIYIYNYEYLKPIIKIISISCTEHSKEVYQLA